MKKKNKNTQKTVSGQNVKPLNVNRGNVFSNLSRLED
jgi:hypothetical protein